MGDDGLTRYAYAIVALAACLRVIKLGSESLHYDEAYSVVVSSTGFFELLTSYPQLSPHPPLYFLLLRYWSQVFNTTEAGVRLLSAVAGILSVVLIYKLGARLFDTRVGAVSALILALSQFHIYHAQNARMYTLLTFLTLGSFYSYLRLCERQTTVFAVSYVVFSVLMLYTHVYGGFVILAQILYNVSSRWIKNPDVRRLSNWELVPLQVLVSVLYLPLLAIQLSQILLIQSEGQFIDWIRSPTLGNIVLSFMQYVGYQSNVLSFVRAFPFALLALVVGTIGILRATNIPNKLHYVFRSMSLKNATDRLDNEDAVVLLLTWVSVVHLVPFVLSYVITPVYITRSTISASLGFFILVAAGIKLIDSRTVQFAVVAILIISLIVPLPAYFGSDQRDQWEEATQFVNTHAQANETVLLVSDSAEDADLRVPFKYYSQRENLETRALGTNSNAYPSQLKSIVENRSSVWLLFGLSHSVGDGKAVALDIVEKNCRQRIQRHYVRIDVYQYECSK